MENSPMRLSGTAKKVKKNVLLRRAAAGCLLCASLVLSVTGCGKSGGQDGGQAGQGGAQEAYRNDVPVEDLKAAVVEALGDDYWPNMALGAEELETMTGISADLCEEYLAEMPMISTNVDTLMILKAKEGRLEELTQAAEAYQEKMQGDTMQYPMNLGKIQASQIRVFGNYVCYAQLGADTTEAEEQGDEAVIKHCRQVNEEVLSAIEGQLKQG